MAEDERHRILKRANDGRASARKRGVRFGLSDHQQAEALKRLAAGESCRAIGKTMGVHQATIARLAGWERAAAMTASILSLSTLRGRLHIDHSDLVLFCPAL